MGYLMISWYQRLLITECCWKMCPCSVYLKGLSIKLQWSISGCYSSTLDLNLTFPVMKFPLDPHTFIGPTKTYIQTTLNYLGICVCISYIVALITHSNWAQTGLLLEFQVLSIRRQRKKSWFLATSSCLLHCPPAQLLLYHFKVLPAKWSHEANTWAFLEI
jgi:hypothetical protein